MKNVWYTLIATLLGFATLAYAEPAATDSMSATDPANTTYLYNRDDACAYARTWFALQNPNYYAYTSDCANFVSQCMLAGGIPMTNSWYSYEAGSSFSVGEPWRLAQNMFQYFSSPQNPYLNGDVIELTEASDVAGAIASSVQEAKPIQPGDLLFTGSKGSGKAGCAHVTMITKVDDHAIYFSSHSSPKLDENVANIFASSDVHIIRLNSYVRN